MDKQFVIKMENIKNTTLFSSNFFTSPWASPNETSFDWQISDLDTPAQGIPTTFRLEKLFIITLMVVQCALLHPKFQASSSARLTRLSLGPLIIGWAVLYPFRLPAVPFKEREIVDGFLAVMMVFKSIEFTFASGPYRMRGLKTVKGAPVWEKDSAAKPSLEDPESGLGDLALWTALLFTSQRGLRWSWGPVGKGNESSFLQALLELARLQMIILPCLGFVLYSQDFTAYTSDPRSALVRLGMPSFRGLGLLACAFHSACTMLVVSCSLEMFTAVPLLLTYPFYPIAKNIGLSPKLYELLNPANYPPQFGPLFDCSSLANFWGKSWHQKCRRAFLFCGGKPAMPLAKALGGSKNVQKACGAMGVFALSGLLHEYPLYAYQREPHPYPRQLFKTFPASFLFFFVQSFGVILEPFIIPYIPKRLGGPKLWTISFLFLTAPLFTKDACRPAGLFDQYRRPEQWTWLDFLIPPPLAIKLLAHK
ncbi:hypothetical protein PGTUg99_026724 [Puccinia graminis f. sp. tritici]|uniref:Wax synthase domain-containing protein n=1 Tax=Puccinia graminis f. sp. tritici TaxID=56615 RepID=A0A5B0RD85_PUCGR|nr:hypothetical protein PGTUg99_026724 [Puccinia graminis f. sp. tritici]